MSETTIHAVELKQTLQSQVEARLKGKDNEQVLAYYRKKYQATPVGGPENFGPGTSANST